jgi:hypothetical protein
MSKWSMRGHFRYLRFKTFPMTPRTPLCEVFWALLSNSKHLGVPEDSKSPTLGVLGFTPHTCPKWGCDTNCCRHLKSFKSDDEPLTNIDCIRRQDIGSFKAIGYGKKQIEHLELCKPRWSRSCKRKLNRWWRWLWWKQRQLMWEIRWQMQAFLANARVGNLAWNWVHTKSCLKSKFQGPLGPYVIFRCYLRSYVP